MDEGGKHKRCYEYREEDPRKRRLLALTGVGVHGRVSNVAAIVGIALAASTVWTKATGLNTARDVLRSYRSLVATIAFVGVPLVWTGQWIPGAERTA